MYHSFDFGVVQARGGQDDAINNVAAGAATGTLFRATCALRRPLCGSGGVWLAGASSASPPLAHPPPSPQLEPARQPLAA